MKLKDSQAQLARRQPLNCLKSLAGKSPATKPSQNFTNTTKANKQTINHMKTTHIFVSPTGGLSAVADERAERIAKMLGDTTKRRASNVVPANPIKRAFFRFLRSTFTVGDPVDLAVVNWTRSWKGPWQVRFADTPHQVAYQHPSRHVCIKWEIEQLEKNFANQ